MSLINKEKVLNGVGKAVDVTNKAADKASSFVKEKEIDKKAMKAAKTAEKGIKIAGFVPFHPLHIGVYDQNTQIEKLPQSLPQKLT